MRYGLSQRREPASSSGLALRSRTPDRTRHTHSTWGLGLSSFPAQASGQAILKILLLSLTLALLGPQVRAPAQPKATLKPETIEAFNEYVEVVEELIAMRVNGEKTFLWLDGDHRRRLLVAQGDVLVEDLSQDIGVPGGMVHDWLGAMFVPEASLKEVLDVLQAYDRHSEIYPEVVESKLLERQGDAYKGRLRLRKKKVLTAVLETEHEAKFFRVSEKRWHSRSYSTRIAEVKDDGKPNERELPVGQDSGFLWRLNAYWRLEQDDDGVFAECQTISLSRRVPRGMGWLIKPFIKNMPEESLEATLQATRLAVKNWVSPTD